MINTLDIAWLGGLLEGEGSFMIKKGCPIIALQTTDEDILTRAAKLLGVAQQGVGRKPKGKDTYKLVHACRVHGTSAIAWMMTLYSFFGERRQAKVKEIIETWKASSAAPRAPRGQRYMAICHPDKPRKSNMLCGTCYMKEWRKKTGRNKAYYSAQKAIAA